MYSIIVFNQALIHESLVVDIAFHHTQSLIQGIGIGHGVTYPTDVTQIVFLTLLYLDIDVNVLVVNRPHRVLNDCCITETHLVILVDKGLLSLTIALWSKFLGLEEIAQFACLMNLTKGTLREEATLDFLVGHLFITIKDNAANLHLGFLIDIDIEHHLILTRYIIALTDINLSILIAFIIKILCGQDLSTVNEVLRQTHALGHTQFVLQILALALLHTMIFNIGDTRTQGQMDTKIDLRIHDRVGGD